MKKIICEICGSSDMMKQEGVFVCQSCGCKYSAEEIRKMLSEVPDPESAPGASGAPEPATAVQPVPAVSQKFENLRQLARRAKAANDSKDAAKYYGEMLLENPNDWEAAFYSVFYEAHNCTIAQIGVSAMRVRNNLPNVMNLIKNYVTEEEKNNAYAEVMTQISKFGTLLFQNAVSFIQKSPEYIRYNTKVDEKGKPPEQVVQELMNKLKAAGPLWQKGSDWLAPILRMLLDMNILMDEETNLDRKTVYSWYEVTETALQTAQKVLSYTPDFESGIYTKESKEIFDVGKDVFLKMKEIRQRQEEEKKKVAEAYWAEHAEEKAELETKKADLAGELDNFTKAIDEQQQKKADLESRIKNFRSPLQIKFVQINKEIDKQQTLYASLGLFKGKEKKQIEDMILALKKSRPKDQEMIAEIDQLLAPLKAELKDVSDEIIRLTNLKTDATKDLAAVEKKLNREAE